MKVHFTKNCCKKSLDRVYTPAIPINKITCLNCLKKRIKNPVHFQGSTLYLKRYQELKQLTYREDFDKLINDE